MAHLGYRFVPIHCKGLLEIFKSVKIAIVVTAKLVDVFTSLLDCTQEILTVLV